MSWIHNLNWLNFLLSATDLWKENCFGLMIGFGLKGLYDITKLIFLIDDLMVALFNSNYPLLLSLHSACEWIYFIFKFLIRHLQFNWFLLWCFHFLVQATYLICQMLFFCLRLLHQCAYLLSDYIKSYTHLINIIFELFYGRFLLGILLGLKTQAYCQLSDCLLQVVEFDFVLVLEFDREKPEFNFEQLSTFLDYFELFGEDHFLEFLKVDAGVGLELSFKFFSVWLSLYQEFIRMVVELKCKAQFVILGVRNHAFIHIKGLKLMLINEFWY